MKIKILYFLLISLLFTNSRDFPEFDVITNTDPYPSNMFIHIMGSNIMGILNPSLEPYWHINSGGGINSSGGGMGLDFKENNGYISYFNKEFTCWIIADENMNELDTLQSLNGITDYHDMRITNNGNYLIQSYDSMFVDMSQLVNGGNSNALIGSILRIQEFDENHNLIYDWNAMNHLNIADYVNLNLTNHRIVWMHGNSIEIDFDDNLILSNRRSSEIIKIDRISGEVIWILGGPLNEFEILDDSFNGVSKQHDVRRINNGNILIFDNGNGHQPPTSRVVEYEIDEENKTATLVWEFINPYNQLSLSMGSSQRLPNQNTLINWGNRLNSGANIMEIDYEKNIVLELQYLTDSDNVYKVRKSDWEFNIPMLIGDANLDNIINILDVIYQVNKVLYNNESLTIFDLYKIDMNKDAGIDVLDIVELVNIILS